jgi:hypothetical protein
MATPDGDGPATPQRLSDARATIIDSAKACLLSDPLREAAVRAGQADGTEVDAREVVVYSWRYEERSAAA